MDTKESFAIWIGSICRSLDLDNIAVSGACLVGSSTRLDYKGEAWALMRGERRKIEAFQISDWQVTDDDPRIAYSCSSTIGKNVLVTNIPEVCFLHSGIVRFRLESRWRRGVPKLSFGIPLPMPVSPENQEWFGVLLPCWHWWMTGRFLLTGFAMQPSIKIRPGMLYAGPHINGKQNMPLGELVGL